MGFWETAVLERSAPVIITPGLVFLYRGFRLLRLGMLQISADAKGKFLACIMERTFKSFHPLPFMNQIYKDCFP